MIPQTVFTCDPFTTWRYSKGCTTKAFWNSHRRAKKAEMIDFLKPTPKLSLLRKSKVKRVRVPYSNVKGPWMELLTVATQLVQLIVGQEGIWASTYSAYSDESKISALQRSTIVYKNFHTDISRTGLRICLISGTSSSSSDRSPEWSLLGMIPLDYSNYLRIEMLWGSQCANYVRHVKVTSHTGSVSSSKIPKWTFKESTCSQRISGWLTKKSLWPGWLKRHF